MEGNSSGSHKRRCLSFLQVHSDFLYVLSHWEERKSGMGMFMVTNIAMMGHTQSTQSAEVGATKEQGQSAHSHGLSTWDAHSWTMKATIIHSAVV